jgi:hypothetical protein
MLREVHDSILLFLFNPLPAASTRPSSIGPQRRRRAHTRHGTQSAAFGFFAFLLRHTIGVAFLLLFHSLGGPTTFVVGSRIAAADLSAVAGCFNEQTTETGCCKRGRTDSIVTTFPAPRPGELVFDMMGPWHLARCGRLRRKMKEQLQSARQTLSSNQSHSPSNVCTFSADLVAKTVCFLGISPLFPIFSPWIDTPLRYGFRSAVASYHL